MIKFTDVQFFTITYLFIGCLKWGAKLSVMSSVQM